jgi:acyl-CoA thioester hydrolase
MPEQQIEELVNTSRITETNLRVRYAETDTMGVVYHANYLIWFEVGRGDYFRALGQDYGEWEKRGFLLPVSEAYARFHAPARYGDLITVRTSLAQLRSRELTLDYQVIHGETGQILATGWTKHICVDHESHVRRLPEILLRLLEGEGQSTPEP